MPYHSNNNSNRMETPVGFIPALMTEEIKPYLTRIKKAATEPFYDIVLERIPVLQEFHNTYVFNSPKINVRDKNFMWVRVSYRRAKKSKTSYEEKISCELKVISTHEEKFASDYIPKTKIVGKREQQFFLEKIVEKRKIIKRSPKVVKPKKIMVSFDEFKALYITVEKDPKYKAQLKKLYTGNEYILKYLYKALEEKSIIPITRLLRKTKKIVEKYLEEDRELGDVENKFNTFLKDFLFIVFVLFSFQLKRPHYSMFTDRANEPEEFSMNRKLLFLRTLEEDTMENGAIKKPEMRIAGLEDGMEILYIMSFYKYRERARSDKNRTISDYESGTIIKQKIGQPICQLSQEQLIKELNNEVLTRITGKERVVFSNEDDVYTDEMYEKEKRDHLERTGIVLDLPKEDLEGMYIEERERIREEQFVLRSKGRFRIKFAHINLEGKDDGILRYKSTKSEALRFRYDDARKYIVDETQYVLHDGEQYAMKAFFMTYIEIVLPEMKEGKKKSMIEKVKAFAATVPDPAFHRASAYSPMCPGLCILESYYFLYGYEGVLDTFRKSKSPEKAVKRQEWMNEKYYEESYETRVAVTEGNLLNFLLLKAKYHGPMYMRFFRLGVGCIVTEDGFKDVDESEIPQGTPHFLFSHNHVAPCFSLPTRKAKFKKPFSLKPTPVKEIKNLWEENWAFDFESSTDKEGWQLPRIVCLKCVETQEQITFYGNDCHIKLIEFMEARMIVTDTSKTHEKKAVKKYKFWSHNGANYDNLLFVRDMFDRNENVNVNIDGSSVKNIEFNNITVKDLCLFYTTKLENLAEGFKLHDIVDGEKKEIRKLKFPYKFLTDANLDYQGEAPDEIYWNKPEDREEYMNTPKSIYTTETYGNHFDMRKYIEEYCMIDVEIVARVVKEHLSQAVGEILIQERILVGTGKKAYFKKDSNGNYITKEVWKKYDVRECITAAQMALKMFKQVGLQKELNASPDNIRDIEREAYMGGRTEVFMKMLKGVAHYFDINSSYPASMMDDMPVRFIDHLVYDEEENVETFEKTNLYYCRSVYMGRNKRYIPNLLTRTKEGNVIALKNADWGWRWGVELINAKKHCDIFVKEEIVYEPFPIFKEFITALYAMRKKCKNPKLPNGEPNPYYNEALSNFLKLIMNSLYGKFGQQKTSETKLVNEEGFFDLMFKDDSKLTDWIEISQDHTGKPITFLAKMETTGKTSIGDLVRFSSYIAAASRTKLAEGMDAVGHENVCYCDTDSIITTNSLPKEMIDGSALGAWKNELGNDHIVEAYFAAPKAYQYTTKEGEICVKGKGINKDVMKDLFKNDKKLYEKITSGGEVQAKSMQFRRDITGVRIVNGEKVFQSVYNKREWDGNESIPFENVEEWRKNRIVYDIYAKIKDEVRKRDKSE